MEEEDENRQCRMRKERKEDDQGCCLEKILAISDDEDEAYDLEKFQISEEAVAEMMRWLQQEIGLSGSPSPSPPSQETTFVTINGNEESCGSSFSGPDSTVMASIDTRGVACASCFIGGPSDRAPLFWPWPVNSTEDGGYCPAPAGTAEAAAASTAAALEEDEEDWLARALDEPEFDFEDLL